MAQHAEDVRAFRADGYVKLPPDLLAPEDLAELQRVYKREQAKWRAIRAEERERAMAEPDSSDSRAPGAGAWRSPGYFDFPWTPETDDVFKKLVCNERLVKIVESVIGDDVFLQDLRARTVIGLSEQREGDGTLGAAPTRAASITTAGRSALRTTTRSRTPSSSSLPSPTSPSRLAARP